MLRCYALLGALLAVTVGCESLPPLGPATLNDPPLAEFRYAPERPVVGAAVRFEALRAPQAPGFSVPQRFAWTFGDGAQREGAIVEHAFAEATTYSVTLVTANDRGRQATVTRTVQVR